MRGVLHVHNGVRAPMVVRASGRQSSLAPIQTEQSVIPANTVRSEHCPDDRRDEGGAALREGAGSMMPGAGLSRNAPNPRSLTRGPTRLP